MNLSDYRKIAPAVNEALRAAFAAHGLTMGKLTASVSELDGTIRYTIQAADANLRDAAGNQTTPEAERFKTFAPRFGLAATDLGRAFTSAGKTYKIAGMLDTRSEKRFTIERDGKSYVVTAESLKRALGVVEPRPQPVLRIAQ